MPPVSVEKSNPERKKSAGGHLQRLSTDEKKRQWLTKESTVKQTYYSENLPTPLFAKEGSFLPSAAGPRGPLARRVKGREEGFDFRCLHN